MYTGNVCPFITLDFFGALKQNYPGAISCATGVLYTIAGWPQTWNTQGILCNLREKL